MKKKILLMMPSMYIGGAERSFLGLIDNIDYEKYEVDIFLFRREGELLEKITKKAKGLPEIKQYTTFDRPIKEVLKSNLWYCGLARILSKVSLKLYCLRNKEQVDVWKSMQYTARYLNPFLPKISEDYDLAISFLGIPFYMNKVKAKKKMAWIHTDYHSLRPNKRLDRKAYKKVNYVVTVSEECRNSFLEYYPELSGKAIVVENCLSSKIIYQQAKEKIDDLHREKNTKVLLSIGRFCEAKNFDNVPEICAEIIKRGEQVCWYLIGYGGQEGLIREKIKEFGMQNHVKMLGMKKNPYPYIQKCDVYIQPSRYEGKCVTVREAQILHKPVIITNYTTAGSQLENGVDGVIVPLNNKGCAEKIVHVLRDERLLADMVKNISERDYTNVTEVQKIYNILNKG